MPRESQLWQWLSKARPIFREDLHLNRVENSVVSGYPDVEGYLRERGQVWIELKVAKLSGGRVRTKVRDKQVEWHRRRAQAGQRSWFLVQVGKHRYMLNGKWAKDLQIGPTEYWFTSHATLVEDQRQALLLAADIR